jgi:hypothetical protein
MSEQNHIQGDNEELNGQLPAGGQQNPFAVPEGYFAGLAASVMARIHAAEPSAAEEMKSLSPLLAGMSRSMPYHLPEGYFAGLAEELPLLTAPDPVPAFSRQLPYSVPQHYFSELPDLLLQRVAPARAKVIPLMRRGWVRLAVAAVLTGLVALAGIQYLGGEKEVTSPAVSVAQQLKNVSTTEIDNFIRNTAAAPQGGTTANTTRPAAKTEVRKMLTDVSDSELDDFLSQVPAEEEDIIMIN